MTRKKAGRGEEEIQRRVERGRESVCVCVR